MKDMKLVVLASGEYDDYGISGLYWVPKDCDAHRVIAEAIEAKYGGSGWPWEAKELIPSDWKVASYQHVHLESVYWNEIGKEKAKREKAEAEAKKYAGMTKAQIKMAKEEEAAITEAVFKARGGIRLSKEAMFADRTGAMIDACREVGAKLADAQTAKLAGAMNAN